jgi:hypothetical protein
MKFMTFVKSRENQGMPPQELFEAIAKLGAEASAAGTLVETGGLVPTVAEAARVELRDGEVTVVDGPFSETKEVVGGYAVFELNSWEEAIQAGRDFMDVHKQYWPGWEGESEIRRIYGPEDHFPPQG